MFTCQDTNWSQSVLPEITNTAPMGKGVGMLIKLCCDYLSNFISLAVICVLDVGMLDLDFFGPSPASPATPSTGNTVVVYGIKFYVLMLALH